MAMYESEGYCPQNSFSNYPVQNAGNIPSMWECTRKILGDRIGYMVYTDYDSHCYDWPYVVDCLVGSTSTLGTDVAHKLEVMIPNCTYAETGRKILVTDVIDPFQIPEITRDYNVEKFVGSDKLYVLEDKRYIVGMIDEGEAVHLYFCRKESV